MDLIRAFYECSTADVADSQTTGGVLDPQIRPLHMDMKCAGRALTCRCAPGDNLAAHKAIAQAQPGDVLVIDGGGYADCSLLGELMALSCRGKGVAGAIIDGCCRDTLALVQMGFPTFARGIHPKGPRREDPGTIGQPVVCGGVTVETGDIILADADGVVVVRPEEAQAVLAAAQAKAAREETLRPLLAEGKSVYELLTK